MHCFSADVDVAKRCLDLGLHHLARRARDLQERARACPTWRASSPSTASWSRPTARSCRPIPIAGQRNEPAWIALTVARVAELRGEDAERLAEATSDTALRLFRIPGEHPAAAAGRAG